MRIAADVNLWGVSPVLWTVLGLMAERHRFATAEELYVTSLRRAPGLTPSKHSPPFPELSTAADVRRWALDARGITETWCEELRQRLAGNLVVVREPEDLTQEQLARAHESPAWAPHIHVQLAVVSWWPDL